MNKIYISGPFTGDKEVNIRKAIDAADQILKAGMHPIVPHLNHYWDLIHQHPYADWHRWALFWVTECDALLRLPGRSLGADEEVDLAEQEGIPVFLSIQEVLYARKKYLNGEKWQVTTAEYFPIEENIKEEKIIRRKQTEYQ